MRSSGTAPGGRRPRTGACPGPMASAPAAISRSMSWPETGSAGGDSSPGWAFGPSTCRGQSSARIDAALPSRGSIWSLSSRGPGGSSWAAARLRKESRTSSAARRPAGQEMLILLLGVAAIVAAVSPGLRETGTPPGWDQSVHLRDSLVYERILRHPSALTNGVFGAILHGSEDFPLLTPSGYYPPLVPGLTALLYRVAGRSY